MKVKSMFLAVTGLFIAAGVSAQSVPASPDQGSRMQRHAIKIDKDGDGAISREEASASKRLSARFDAIDGNKDGKLSREEMQASRAAAYQKRRAAFEQRFKEADQDGDGALSKAEVEKSRMPGLALHFEKADTNGDGKVSREELQAGRKHLRSQHAARFKAADKNGDGAITKEEAEAGNLRGLVKHFDQLDADKDGKIGQEELHARKGLHPAKTM